MTKRPKHNRLQQTGAMSRRLRISRSKSPLESTSALAKIGRSASKDPRLEDMPGFARWRIIGVATRATRSIKQRAKGVRHNHQP